jgi:hypothetical protein
MEDTLEKIQNPVIGGVAEVLYEQRLTLKAMSASARRMQISAGKLIALIVITAILSAHLPVMLAKVSETAGRVVISMKAGMEKQIMKK